MLLVTGLLVCIPLSGASSAATVYKSYDERGRVTFSDQPPAQAVSVEKMEVASGSHVRGDRQDGGRAPGSRAKKSAVAAGSGAAG
jgi:hypothetical protein